MPDPQKYPTTPDGRHFVVKGRLWRASNPELSEGDRQFWVDQLMSARRKVGVALKARDETAEKRPAQGSMPPSAPSEKEARFGGLTDLLISIAAW